MLHGPNPSEVMHPTRRATLVFLLSALVPACGGEPSDPARVDPLPAWAGELRALFDDQIHPAAVGISLDGVSPAADRALPLRAQAADVVARVRVQTVTRPAVGARMSFTMTLQIGVPTLIPHDDPEPSVEVSVHPESPAFAMVQALEAQDSLRGKTFIGFLKRFAGPEGPEVHFHLTADTAEVAQVIQEVATLQEMAGR